MSNHNNHKTLRNHTYPTPLIIGIAGGSASGKTTIVHEVINQLAPNMVTMIPQDDYYDRQKVNDFLQGGNKIHDYNFDDPSTINFERMRSNIDTLCSGKSVAQTDYNYHDPTRKPGKMLHPSNILIVDGLHALAIPIIRDILNIKIFIEVPENIRLIRRIARDIKERGFSESSIKERFITTVKPMHDQYIEPSKKYADLIISGENDIHESAHRITILIQEELLKRNHTAEF